MHPSRQRGVWNTVNVAAGVTVVESCREELRPTCAHRAWSSPRAAPKAAMSRSGLADVLRGGSRVSKGMPAYRALTDDKLLVLRHFIRQQAEAALTATSK